MKEDGGYAFPSSNTPDTGYYSVGMSLRDYFAAAALTGYIVNGAKLREVSDELISTYAYAQADAMLKAREA